MTKHHLLGICALIALAANLVFAPGAAAADPSAPYYQPQKVVYHNNGRGADSAKYFHALLKNLSNHLKAVGAERLDIKVVNHGDGVSLLEIAAKEPELAKSIDALRASGVQFLICQNTLNERSIDWRKLYGVKQSDIVPSGIAHLIHLQQQGYIYVHP
jgi:intracellular sulfur oxidation DsrE/DsrF family protein